MHNLLYSPFIVPLGAFAMVAIVVSMGLWSKTRQKELEIQHDLQLRRMEHERQLKQLEIDKLKAGKGPEA